MKRLWFVIPWLVLITSAFAQPIQCPDRPTADSTNACANTRFVHSVAGGGGGGGGIINVGPSLLATAGVLPNSPVYANGTLGVGATLTAGSNSTLTVDSTVAVLTNIILVKDQASALQNGIYTVTTAGSGSVPWVLTRVTYFDQAAEMLAGSYTYITAGATNINTSWTLQTTVAIVGTSAVNFALFSQVSGLWTASGGDVFRPSGFVGIDIAPSAWGSPYTGGLQISTISQMRQAGDISATVSNGFFNGSAYKYLNSGFFTLSLENNSGGFDWYTAPSGTAAGTAITTRRMNLNNIGGLTLDAYGLGVLNSSASGAVASKPAYTTSIIYAADYGVAPANSRGTNDTNLQAAITACLAVTGCILQLPAGYIQTSTTFTCPDTIIIRGAGMGLTGASSNKGTIIDNNLASGNVFFCKTWESVQFQDLTILMSAVGSTATGIAIETFDLSLPGANIGSRVNNVSTRGGGTGISLHGAQAYTISNNYILNASSSGINISSKDNGLTDLGDGNVISNFIQKFSAVGGLAGVYFTGSAVPIKHNKIIGYPYGIWINADVAFSSVAIIIGNSIEEFTASCLNVSQATAGNVFGYIDFSNNECFSNAGASIQSGVNISAGAAQYISTITIANNQIGFNTAGGTVSCVSISDGDSVNVHDNICNVFGSAGSTGYRSASNATKIQFGNNIANGIASMYACGVATRVLDAFTFASWGNC